MRPHPTQNGTSSTSMPTGSFAGARFEVDLLPFLDVAAGFGASSVTTESFVFLHNETDSLLCKNTIFNSMSQIIRIDNLSPPTPKTSPIV
jgi:hypothetical protein